MLECKYELQMIFGKKYIDKDFDERAFENVIQEGLYLATALNLVEFFPFIATLDF